MSGDDIRTLPTSPNRQARPSELELVYQLFGQKENYPIIKKAITPFKSAFVGAILFGILSLPFVFKISDKVLGNPIYGRLILIVAFFIVFFIMTKGM
jgi:uncharacterized membrane protein YesL